MQFDVAALRQFISTHASLLTTIAAAAGGTLVILLAFGGVWTFGPESHEVPADAVAVGGPAFTPVVMSPRTATTAAAFSEAGKPVSTPYDDLQRQDDRSLTRAVQRELKRAGCYDGPVNGAWSPSTRKAMGEFTGLVNARLPVDHPDPILLVLLETHDKVFCTPGAVPARKDEFASTGDQRADEARAVRYDEPPASDFPKASPGAPKASGAEREVASAEQESETPEPAYVLGSAAGTAIGAAAATAAAADVDAPGQKSALNEPGTTAPRRTTLTAVGAAATTAADAGLAPGQKSAFDEPGATAPKRTARKYRQPSLSSQVSKGFKNIQRSLNKIFW